MPRAAPAWSIRDTVVWTGVGIIVLAAGIYLIRSIRKRSALRAWSRAPTGRNESIDDLIDRNINLEEEERATQARSGHRLESSDDDVFKRRYYRWDPWLKRIGYFDKSKKK
jgi:hypothetical protein